MKRTITLLILAGLSVSAAAQEPLEVAKAFYATDAWNKAFMAEFGVNSGIEPGLPEDQDEREALGLVRDFLQSGTEADMQSAITTLEALIQQEKRGKIKTSPMILELTGMLSYQMANMTDNNTERQSNLKRAESYLKQAIDPVTGFPNFLRAHKNLANLLFKADKPEEAKTHFIKSIELGDRNYVTFGLLGAIYMNEGKLVSSETALRNSIMINPNVIEFKQLLGQVLLLQERYQEANAIFGELLQKRPSDTNFWSAQANCFIALDNIDEAARILEILRFMGGANVDSLLLLGDVYINKDMIDEATELYLEAINEKDSQASKLQRFIQSAENLNNYAAYEQGMEVITAIDTKFKGELTTENEIDLLSLKSEINISLGNGEEAAGNLKELLKRDPFNPRALLSLARYYSEADPDPSLDQIEQDLQQSRNEEQAIIYYERAQELDDDMARVRALIGEAQLRVKRDELDKAADLIEDAQSIRYQDYIQAYLDQIRQTIKSRRR